MTTALKNKGGRPKKLVKDEHLPLITELAGRGVSEANIARACGMDRAVFRHRKQEDPRIQEALDAGRAIEHDSLVGVLYDAAVKDRNLVAAMFLLKTRHGYREGEAMQGQGVTVNITLPGAMSASQYLERVVDGSTESLQLPS